MTSTQIFTLSINAPSVAVQIENLIDNPQPFFLYGPEPEVKAGNNQRVPLGEFTLTEGVPNVGTGQLNANALGSFTLSEALPTISNPTVSVRGAIGSAGSYSTTINAPTIQTGVNILAQADPFVLTQPGVYLYQLSVIEFTGDAVPESHVEDSKKLQADAYVELFEIHLNDGATTLYVKSDKTTVWQGNSYEGTGIKLDGVGKYADDQTARPKLNLSNPEGVYSYLVDQGYLENATIVRYRVLKDHIDIDAPIYRREQWRVSRIANLRRNLIALELRDNLDGQFFLTPGRMFIPPDFPQVRLR